LLAYVDEFVFLDEVQFTKRDWRNRNRIKTPHGARWLTVPVTTKGKFNQKISETSISGDGWQVDHLSAMENSYRGTSHYEEISSIVAPFYKQGAFSNISELNQRLTREICEYLDIKTTIKNSKEFDLEEGGSKRLASICCQLGAKTYVTGPAAANYLDTDVLSRKSIEVEWFQYSSCEGYDQPWGEFLDKMSIIDTLFCCGKNAKSIVGVT